MKENRNGISVRQNKTQQDKDYGKARTRPGMVKQDTYKLCYLLLSLFFLTIIPIRGAAQTDTQKGRQERTRKDETKQGMARHDKPRQGKARQGRAGQNKTR